MANSFVHTRTTAYSDLLASKFSRFRDQRKFTDCQLVVEEEAGREELLDCHAIIISSGSPVIEKRLNNLKSDGQTKQLKFSNISAKAMKLILDYMYTGDMYTGFPTVTESDLKNLISASDFLDIPELKERLLEEVRHIVTPRNALGFFWLSQNLYMGDTECSIREVFKTSFYEIVMSEEFLANNIDQLVYILQDEHLYKGVYSYPFEYRLLALLRWFRAEKNKECDVAIDVIKYYLRDCPLALRTLQAASEQYAEIFAEHEKLQAQMDEAMKNKDKSDRQASVAEHLGLVVVDINKFAEWQSESDKVFKCYEPKEGKIKPFVSLPSCLGDCPGVCKYEGVGLIATGGRGSKDWAIYHAVEKKWVRKRTRLVFSRYNHASVCINEELFLVGGVELRQWGSRVCSNSVHSLVMDMKNSRWQEGPSVPEKLNHIKLVYFDTDLYVMGDMCPRLYRFDVKLREWSKKRELSHLPGKGFGLAAGKDVIYAVGEDLASVYSLSTDVWTNISRPLKRHSYGALVFHEGKLFLLGGDKVRHIRYANEILAVEIYDEENKHWDFAPFDMPNSMKYSVAFSMADCRSG